MVKVKSQIPANIVGSSTLIKIIKISHVYYYFLLTNLNWSPQHQAATDKTDIQITIGS